MQERNFSYIALACSQTSVISSLGLMNRFSQLRLFLKAVRESDSNLSQNTKGDYHPRTFYIINLALKICLLFFRNEALKRVSGHFTPKTFHPRKFHPGTFHPKDISPRRHFTPKTFHPENISPRRHFTPKTFHPEDISPRRHFTPRTFHPTFWKTNKMSQAE